MSGARELSPDTPLLQTDVAVYLGDCTGGSLFVVCDGVSTEAVGSTWERALHALAHPTPPGPYPVSERFTIFVHETSGDATAGARATTALRLDVRCDGKWAHASVRSAQSSADLSPIPYVIGDDVVTASRRVLEAALARPGL
jgi:hypothetical protein